MSAAIATILLADFFTGLVHWWEDRYGNPEWPVIGPLVVEPNIVHHRDPLHFTRSNFLARNYQPLGLACLFGALSYCLGLPLIVTIAILLSGLGNEVHVWAHRSRRDNGPLISLLHDMGLLQGPRQHSTHHRKPYSTHFCVMTNWLNPLLEVVRFWPAIESALEWFRVRPFMSRGDHECI